MKEALAGKIQTILRITDHFTFVENLHENSKSSSGNVIQFKMYEKYKKLEISWISWDWSLILTLMETVISCFVWFFFRDLVFLLMKMRKKGNMTSRRWHYVECCLVASLINRLADWPPNYHKPAQTFPKIFCTPSFNKSADSKYELLGCFPGL